MCGGARGQIAPVHLSSANDSTHSMPTHNPSRLETTPQRVCCKNVLKLLFSLPFELNEDLWFDDGDITFRNVRMVPVSNRSGIVSGELRCCYRDGTSICHPSRSYCKHTECPVRSLLLALSIQRLGRLVAGYRIASRRNRRPQ